MPKYCVLWEHDRGQPPKWECFATGTHVLTPDGQRAIEALAHRVSIAVGLEPIELPCTDSAVVNRRADQNRAGTGVAEFDDLFRSSDPAPHGDQTEGWLSRICSIRLLVPGPRLVPTRARSRISRWRTPHSIAASASSSGSSVPQAAGAAILGSSVEQVETEDNPVCSGLFHDFGQLAWALHGLESGNDRA